LAEPGIGADISSLWGQRKTAALAAEATLDPQCLPPGWSWFGSRALHRVSGHPFHFCTRFCSSLKRRS